MADDHFGFLDANVPKVLTPPAGYEGVHQDGMSWARQGDRFANTSWITVAQFNHLIAQFRGLATLPGVDLADVASASPLLLREAVIRAIAAVLSGTDIGGFGVMLRTDYDADADGLVDLAKGGTGVAALDNADLRDKIGVSDAIAAAIEALGIGPGFADAIAVALATKANADDARIMNALQSGDVATFIQFNSAAPGKTLQTASVWGATVALTDAATIAVNMNNGYDFKCTIAGNRTQGAATNIREGKKGAFHYKASGGTRSLTLDPAYKLQRGVPAGPYPITTSEKLMIPYVCEDGVVEITAVMRRTL